MSMLIIYINIHDYVTYTICYDIYVPLFFHYVGQVRVGWNLPPRWDILPPLH